MRRFVKWEKTLAAFETDDRLARALTIVLCLFALMLILSIAVAQMLASLLIVGCAVLVIKRRYAIHTPLDGFILAFAVARVVSVMLSEHFELSLRTLYAETPFLILFFAINQLRTLSRSETVTLTVWALMAGGIIASLYGTLGFAIGFLQRASSPGTGYYTMGTYLTAVCTLALVAARDRTLFPNRGLLMTSVAVMLIGLVLTLNRVQWLIIAVVVVIIGAIRERRLLVIFVASWVLALVFFPSLVVRLQQAIHFTSNMSDRDVLWRGATMLLGDHPLFGYGPGTFNRVFQLRDLVADKEISGWHNDYLQIYVESGLVGLVAFVALVTAIFWKGIQRLRVGVDSVNSRTLIKAVLAATATILVSSLAASAALDIIILMLLSLLMSILSTHIKILPKRQTAVPK